MAHAVCQTTPGVRLWLVVRNQGRATVGTTVTSVVRGPATIWRLLADAALCFANHLGGTVVIGVSDHVPGPAAFAGSELDPDIVKRRVWELTELRLVVSVKMGQYRGVGLVVIDVPQSPDIHADAKGSAPRRIGTSCIPMTPREQDHLRDEKQGIDWSAQPSRRSTGAISPRALEAVRERLRRYPDARAALS